MSARAQAAIAWSSSGMRRYAQTLLESFAEREQKWNALQADPELLEAFAESEKNGPLVFNVENLLLQPTSFSAVT